MKKADTIKILIGLLITLITAFSAYRNNVIETNQERSFGLLQKHIEISNKNFNNVRENYLMKKDHLTYHRR